MSRLKALSVLAGTLAMLAVSATPVSAIWKSNNGQTTGTIKILKTGEFSYAGARFKCPNTAEVKAQWQIQGAGQIKEQQKITTAGPHLQIQVKSWGKCELFSVSECNFQLEQQEGNFIATVAIAKHPCFLGGGACQIQIPVGMEKTQGSGTGINVGLKSAELSNASSNQLDKITITSGGVGQLPGEGIFAQSPPLCPLPTSEEVTLTGLELEAEGVKAV